MPIASGSPLRTVYWVGGLDGCCELIDQTLLPGEFKLLQIRDIETMWEAIRVLRVRGAPAIGVAAGFGLVLGVRSVRGTMDEFLAAVKKASDYLASSRPTAVNLFWALDRVARVAAENRSLPVEQLKARLLAEANAIRDEDAAMCRAIGANGKSLITAGCGVLTHCNAGGLATAEFGTALAPMFAAHAAGVPFRVFADETRPLLQGARLTAWELMQAGIDVTLITDSTAGMVMRQGKVNLAIVGADRIAANGDTANKIGTYSVALLARAHNIPFYVAAPSSTFDLTIPDGSGIPIEERGAEEVTNGFGRGGSRTAPEGVKVFAPAFDVTPHDLIAAIITERGVIQPVNEATVRKAMGAKQH
ncbi:MAG: S-methyl-5-thioribose-1-phosphate isomerase, partial [Phycisphaerae bacterium]|nr:S-methyl-5-thioribose-1-phosphate isomerase [Phycisphaerae bacterium]